MAIQIDSTAFSTVVYCDTCTHWVVSASGRGEALILGARHEESVHPGDRQARGRLNKSEERSRKHAGGKLGK
jgi:hypothetical protein